MIQQTSLHAYTRMQQTGRLGECQKRVLLWLQNHPCTSDLEISSGTGLPINNVTARRNELYNKGLVRCTGKKTSPTGRPVMQWEVRI